MRHDAYVAPELMVEAGLHGGLRAGVGTRQAEGVGAGARHELQHLEEERLQPHLDRLEDCRSQLVALDGVRELLERRRGRRITDIARARLIVERTLSGGVALHRDHAARRLHLETELE